jgi:soluble cytochrome b562
MMKSPLFCVSAAVLIATILGGSARALADDDDDAKTALAKQMQQMSNDFRSVRKIIGNAARKQDAIGFIEDMEDCATSAKALAPKSAGSVPAADRPKYLADYKKQMDGLIADIQKLDDAVKAGKTADATAMLDTLQSDKRAGHKKFNTEKED